MAYYIIKPQLFQLYFFILCLKFGSIQFSHLDQTLYLIAAFHPDSAESAHFQHPIQRACRGSAGKFLRLHWRFRATKFHHHCLLAILQQQLDSLW